MVEAVMLWNEPNNLSHWDFEIDPGWTTFSTMVKAASAAIAAERLGLTRVLGGMSPIDPGFVRTLDANGVLDAVDVVAVHGFPLDWNHWQIHEWPDKLAEIRAVTALPLWVAEVGVSTFGAEEVQEFGLRRTAELLTGQVDRIHWYSLYDLPRAWPASARSLPVVPLRGPPAGSSGAMDAGARGASPSHGSELGRQLPAWSAAVVRSSDARTRAVRSDPDVLLYAGLRGSEAASHEPAPAAGGVRGILRVTGAEVLLSGTGGPTLRVCACRLVTVCRMDHVRMPAEIDRGVCEFAIG